MTASWRPKFFCIFGIKYVHLILPDFFISLLLSIAIHINLWSKIHNLSYENISKFPIFQLEILLHEFVLKSNICCVRTVVRHLGV